MAVAEVTPDRTRLTGQLALIGSRCCSCRTFVALFAAVASGPERSNGRRTRLGGEPSLGDEPSWLATPAGVPGALVVDILPHDDAALDGNLDQKRAAGADTCRRYMLGVSSQPELVVAFVLEQLVDGVTGADRLGHAEFKGFVIEIDDDLIDQTPLVAIRPVDCVKGSALERERCRQRGGGVQHPQQRNDGERTDHFCGPLIDEGVWNRLQRQRWFIHHSLACSYLFVRSTLGQWQLADDVLQVLNLKAMHRCDMTYFTVPQLQIGRVFRQLWKSVIRLRREVFASYHPERHYMRGSASKDRTPLEPRQDRS